eukprot:7333888-Alexandrium_andersonii.AAC.1
MSASLVGSEMCIRDREPRPPRQLSGGPLGGRNAAGHNALYYGRTHDCTFCFQGQEKGRAHWDDRGAA